MASGARLRQLFPTPSHRVELPSAYAFPDGDAPWVRANLVASVDGAATLRGRSGGPGNDTDHAIFALLRALADVILVGSGTATPRPRRSPAGCSLWAWRHARRHWRWSRR